MINSEFLQMVDDELRRARSNFPNMRSVHEGFALIDEEHLELREEAYSKHGQRSVKRLTEELVQIAAMCNRLYDDLLSGDIERI